MNNRTDRPERTAIVVAGPPCSGKTTLARALSRALQVPHLEKDALRLLLFPGGDNDLRQRDFAYVALHAVASALLQRGDSVVLDATYLRPEPRRELASIIHSSSATALLVECTVSAEVAGRRFSEERDRSQHAAMDLTVREVSRLAREFNPAKIGLVVDGLLPVEETLGLVTSAVADGARSPLDEWAGIA